SFESLEQIVVIRQTQKQTYKNAILSYDSTERIAYFFILGEFLKKELIVLLEYVKILRYLVNSFILSEQ
ncbi:hypothetical protein, partial [Bacillus toyonensis]|uniref:hypothetical protein n=1 Tax=Bacillus toyonensis TaxID=155322 RepID=UPI003D251A5F